jgi:hypothetical protein
MKSDKSVISTQPQQPAVPEPNASVDSTRHRSNPARVRGRRAARPKQAGAPEEPLSASSVPVKGDPFSCPPPIYDPDANFIVESAQNEIRELLTPEPESPPPASDPNKH